MDSGVSRGAAGGFGLYRVSHLRAASCDDGGKMKLTSCTGRPVLDGYKLILSVGENPDCSCAIQVVNGGKVRCNERQGRSTGDDAVWGTPH